MIEFRLMTETEVAEILRTSPRNVRRLRMEGRIRHLPGRSPKIDVADLRAYIDEAKIQATVAEASGLTEMELDRIKARVRKTWEHKQKEKSHSAIKLLTQEEAAEALDLTAADVKKLRMQERLAYLPGRPPLIEDADIFDCFVPTEAQLQADAERRWEEARRWVAHKLLIRKLRSGDYTYRPQSDTTKCRKSLKTRKFGTRARRRF